MFNTLHLMFMAQYTELWNAVDPIAERIRSLGHPGAGLVRAVRRASARSRTCRTTPPKALEMVRILVEGHEAVARTARGIFPLAEKAGDEPTADLLTQRLDDPRADRLDAAQPARVAPVGQSSSSMCFGQPPLSRRDIARSASSRPPVWQRAQ